MLAGVFLTVHTPRYCTLEAAFEGTLASEVFRPVRDGLVAQGAELARTALDVVLINSCHLITTFPTVVDGTPKPRATDDQSVAGEERSNRGDPVSSEPKRDASYWRIR